MYNKNNTEIIFPDLIPTNKIGKEEFTMKYQYAGAKRLKDFKLSSNSFYGGRCDLFLFVREYGFYACKEKDKNNIIGIYTHDAKDLTESGKDILKEYYKGTKVVLNDGDKESDEDIKLREEMKKKALSVGLSEALVNTMKAEQIQILLNDIKKADKIKAESPLIEVKEMPKKKGGRPPKKPVA